MEKPELKKIKRELDELFGEKEAGLLGEVIELLEKQDQKFTVLEKLVETIAKLKESQPPAKAFEDLLKVVKELDLTVPESFKVDVNNPTEFPKSFEVKDLKKILEEAVKKIDIPKEIKVSNLKDLPKPQVNVPEKVKVENLKELAKFMPSFPKNIDLNKPNWFKQMTKADMADVIIDVLRAVNKGDGMKIDLDQYRNAKKALAVRLSNGKDFYMAIAGAVAAGNAFPYKTSGGKALEALVNEAGRLQVDVITGGGGGGTDPVGLKNIAGTTIDPATEGKQDSIVTVLGNLLTELQAKADLDETQPVSGTFWQATQPISVASLPLPTGASTSAKQDTAKGVLDNIKTNTDNLTADPATQTTLALMKTALDAVKAQTDKLTFDSTDLQVKEQGAAGGVDPVGLKDSDDTTIDPATEDTLIAIWNLFKSLKFDNYQSLETKVTNTASDPVNVTMETLATLTNQTKRGEVSMELVNHWEDRGLAYAAANT